MIRPPAVAGRFYSADPEQLLLDVDSYVEPVPPGKKTRALGCVVPHAGYMYSGHVAGAVYAKLQLPRRFVILCPRHFPRGESLAILSEGAWQTPFGEALVDAPLAAALKRVCPLLREDEVAHRAEHSLEVQLPFLQRLAGDFRFVPIALGTDQFPAFDELGRAIAQTIREERDEILIIASSDMNHYEPDAITRIKDRKAIERILALDPRGLYDTVRHDGITMCGYGPTTAMLTAAKLLGARHADLVRYATSGDISGDRDEVVGYAGIVIRP